ncbi:ABC transporter ATP-binding protein [Dactylosporangium sp. NPDC049140]|uniref:ABC transporter ATP-binding protein n=1 Tax=Dactylosporangium sp. NPDC049140 TaxID=3155647 RepID=UPI0034116E83
MSRAADTMAVGARLLALCFRTTPLSATAAIVLRLLTAVTFAAGGFALGHLVDSAQRGSMRGAAFAAVGAAVVLGADYILTGVCYTLRLYVVERVSLIDLDSEIVRDICGIEGVHHLEDPRYLDRLEVLRGSSWGLLDYAWGLVESVFNILRLAAALLLLSSISFWLLALPAFALVPLWLEARGQRVVVRTETRTAEAARLERHLFELLAAPGSNKELALTGAGADLAERATGLWAQVARERSRAQTVMLLARAAGWLVFTIGFAGGLALVIWRAQRHHAGLGDIVLTVTVATNLRAAIQGAVSRITETAGHGRLLEPYLWLKRYAAAQSTRTAGAPVPRRLHRGITLNRLRYRYAAATEPALDDVSLEIPAGSVVAIVGEYGSGKSTLVKLLCGLYRPGSGRIEVDGVPLDDIPAADWWERVSVGFQDFGRYRTTLRAAVGLGRPPWMDDDERVTEALAAAGAADLPGLLRDGLDTPLGGELGGVELSEGQWQKTALARACMKPDPLLFVLDEPTAALDAASEAAVFDHYIARARRLGATHGTITVIVSHRFSTVADADLIVVMERGKVTEFGRHGDLVAAGRLYAELYGISRDAFVS